MKTCSIRTERSLVFEYDLQSICGKFDYDLKSSNILISDAC